MTARSREEDEDHQEAAAAVIHLVQLCQTRREAWVLIDDLGQQEAMREEYRGLLQQLWEHLEPHLRRTAGRWMRSYLAPNIESLTQSMFTYVIEALPRLQLDPDKNPISYLTKIAWYGCYDEYGRQYDVHRLRHRASKQAAEADSAPIEAEFRVNDELPPQIAEKGDMMEEQVIEQIADNMIVAAARAFWRTLTADNQQIMFWRSLIDPPRSFKEIAVDLGPGWTEATARKRYSRVMEATRSYLRAQGLLDSDPI